MTKIKSKSNKEEKEDSLDKEIADFFIKNGPINEKSIWPDSMIPSSLADEWVWEDSEKIKK